MIEKFSQCVKSEFASVRSASFTLDKVTVQRKPYTVLITYFFKEGAIKVFLNHLHVMKSNEYDGEHTANMVGLELMRSLGITRARVGQVFHHSVYDGVYSSADERAHGGGCLSMNNHFAQWCGYDETEMTGNWDMGHKLQLVYGDVFLTSKDIKDLNKVVFGLMGEFVSGQDSLRFKEIAMELGHPTLANKKSQETRWARAELSAYYAFFRNLPTMYALYGRDDLEASTAFNATAQKASQKKLKDLTSGENIAMAIGVAQLLDMYSAASLGM